MILKTLPQSKSTNQVSYRAAYTNSQAKQAPLLLLHGVGMQSAAWAPQLAALAKNHQVFALDLPGHGGSAPLPSDARLQDFVKWLFSALDALKLNRVNLVGHSMGALIAAGITVESPERVERVALLNGVFRRDRVARQAVVARAGMIKSGEFDLETPLNRWFAHDPVAKEARRAVAQWLSEMSRPSYATAYKAFAEGDATYADGFQRIACPLLALTGSDDPNSTPEMSEAMASAAMRGRTVIVEGHKHMVNLTAPEVVNAALQEWLKVPLSEEISA